MSAGKLYTLLVGINMLK